MLLRDLGDVRGLFASLKGSLVGVGMTAYSRIIPAYLLQPYHMVVLRKTKDLASLRKRAEIFCLEEEVGGSVAEAGFNSARLLAHPLTHHYLSKLPDPKYLLMYQSYPEVEEQARREGWTLLANPSSLRTHAAERSFFNRMTETLHLNRVPGDIYPIGEIWSRGYNDWAEEIGTEFVAQLPQVQQGGGKGTFFVRSSIDYQGLQDRLRGRVWRETELATISMHTFIEGIPASLALCVTGHGILISRLQRQLIDLPYCKDIAENGVFCGHSWGGDLCPADMEKEAKSQARLIGEYLYEMGYRGILGIDLVIEAGEGRVYPIEINPRYTGAFPMLSQLHMGWNLIPMDVFHMLEFMGLDYDIEPAYLNTRFEKEIRGSHLIMFRMGGDKRASKAGLMGGLYGHSPDSADIRFVQEATDYSEIGNERQFIVIDGPPDGDLGSDDPLYRLCRLLFSFPVVNHQGNLSKEALLAAEWAYRHILE